MKKAALVIGNANYNLSILKNPIKDAEAIHGKFISLGIDSNIRTDLKIVDFKNAIEHYKSSLNNYEVSVFFFAGHGMQIEGENYLCAIDTDFRDETNAMYSSIPLNLIIDLMNKSKVYTKILILDACRDNPYERNFRSTYRRGLAPIYAPIGTIIAFATSPGETASDGVGENGAFTESLLKNIDEQDVKIEEVFKRTRNTLYALTKKKQLSWEHTSLMGDFYFSTSTVSGEYSSVYSSYAISDALYNVSSDSQINEIILQLKSHDWYKQNPAIARINVDILNTSNINELFILGRNIYQAACGGAWSIVEYLQNLRTNLNGYNDEICFHLLNGMVFEIFFDNMGKLRRKFKAEQINFVVPLLSEEKYKTSGQFIMNRLYEFDFRVVYNVIEKTNIVLHLQFEVNERGVYCIKEILMESKNILYNGDGTTEYSISEDIILIERERLVNEISGNIGAPNDKLNCIFIGVPDDINRVGFPYTYQLLKYQIASEE